MAWQALAVTDHEVRQPEVCWVRQRCRAGRRREGPPRRTASYGLDTEFLSEHSYWPRLCLVQLSWSHGIALVDPLACDVRALADVLHTPTTMVRPRGCERPARSSTVRSAAAPRGPVRHAARRRLRRPGRTRSLGSLVSVLLGVRLRQVRAARRLGRSAPDEGLAQALRRRRRATPAPAHRGAAAPPHRPRARTVGSHRVRGASLERATASTIPTPRGGG